MDKKVEAAVDAAFAMKNKGVKHVKSVFKNTITSWQGSNG